MNEMFKELYEKRDQAVELASNLTKAIKSLEHICEHIWSYTGHNHNDNIYECQKCGAKDYR